MRRLAAILAASVIPLCASIPMVKEARELGITQIKNCHSCHTSKNIKDMTDKDMNEVGKWMMDQKAARKTPAGQKAQVSWLKEYYAKKK